MLDTIVTFGVSFIAGFILCDFLTFLKHQRYKKEIEAMEQSSDAEPKKVLIEHHSDCFFAYSDKNCFLGQDKSLVDLVLRVMEDDPSVILAANDEYVIAELRKLVASKESNHTAA